MNLEHLFVQAKTTIDALVVDARADRRALAIIVDALLGKARVRRLVRDDAARVVETDERIDEVARRAAVAQLTSIAVEDMAVVVISGTATSATLIVKRVQRSFVEPGFRIDDAMQMGKFFVDTIHALPDEPEDAWLERAEKWANENPTHPYAQRFREPRWEADVGWTIAWTLSAFQRIEVGHKKAADLMATDVGEDVEVLTCRPWDAYTIEIADELVRVPFDEGIVSFGILSVWYRKDSGQTILILRSRTMTRTMIGPREFPLRPLNMNDSDPAKGPAERAIERIASLAIGTELTMSDPRNVKTLAAPKKKRGGGDDKARNVHRIMGPVTIDCREEIASYIEGTRRDAPKVRTLVCGFWRRVVFGKGRTGRRWTQFPPGWRNLNTDGPIAIRPHRIPDKPEVDG